MFCLFLVLLNASIIYAAEIPPEEPFFTLTLVANPLYESAEYALLVADYLKDINIIVDIQYSTEIPPLRNSNWDLLFGEFPWKSEKEDMRSMFTEDGALNIFGLNTEIPYGNESEQLQNLAISTSDPDEGFNALDDWCKLLMDKILPFLPCFGPRMYNAIWSNIEEYDMRWGLAESSPYMNYNGYHEMQESLDEFNFADSMFQDLNPLSSDDDASDFIISLITEPLLIWSPDNAPLKFGLIVDWEQIADDHFKFYMRDNIFWNPSYNITLNHDDSMPIESSPFMYGLKGEHSNG
ncbi:MAG: hypothetical protein HGN29_14385, partial [Asgard group archaeon]|nr:hypothetical protein [Asgard group archaeon]